MSSKELLKQCIAVSMIRMCRNGVGVPAASPGIVAPYSAVLMILYEYKISGKNSRYLQSESGFDVRHLFQAVEGVEGVIWAYLQKYILRLIPVPTQTRAICEH